MILCMAVGDTINPMEIKTDRNYIKKLRSYRAVNTLYLYNKISNLMWHKEKNSSFSCASYETHKCTLWLERRTWEA
jgi:hypothetical protein